MTGTIRTLRVDKGFGFIKDDSAKEYFFHQSAVYGEGLQGPDTTVRLRFNKGKLAVTDGPYAETKELLGGLLIIEARDRDHAVQLISNHPGVQMGVWEIRPAQDLTPMIEASRKRRSAAR